MDMATDVSVNSIGAMPDFALPLIVSVTGHRDLVQDETPAIRAMVRAFLTKLVDDHPERRVTVMTPLAVGGDQLVAEEALALGVRLVALLPMPRDAYLMELETDEARENFRRIVSRADELLELQSLPERASDPTRSPLDTRDRSYARLGLFLCAHCHILLALWDGKQTDQLGGTGQVVRFHQESVMPGFASPASQGRLILVDDESDLVYHIVCSRDRPDGAPAEGLAPLSAAWLTTDPAHPRTEEMPERYRRILALASEFSRDAQDNGSNISVEASSLANGPEGEQLPTAALSVDRWFQAADWLALRFQRRYLLMLKVVHFLALLMGLTYVFYSDLAAYKSFLLAFLALFALALAIHKLGRRLAWHRKYLDYRTLAEGLRVQFFWAAAGVSTSNKLSKYAHDSFLQMQDADLGWIRSVMRATAIPNSASGVATAIGLDYAIQQWIGDSNSGQLGYYERKLEEKLNRNKWTERFGTAFLYSGAVIFAVFLLSSDSAANQTGGWVGALMGTLLLAVGVRRSYAYSVADFELIKQYEFMVRAFTKARSRIESCESDDQRREVLRLLGDSALEEHAEWILAHRERSVSESDIATISG